MSKKSYFATSLGLIFMTTWIHAEQHQLDHSLYRLKRNSFEDKFHTGKHDAGEAQCLNYSDEFAWHAIHWASWCNHTERVKMLIDTGVDINVKTEWGDTPLMVASGIGNLEVVQMLIDANVNLNTKNELGYTAIYVASLNGQEKVVELLTERGANIEIKDNDGFDPRAVANKEGNTKIVELLDADGSNSKRVKHSEHSL